MLSICTYVDIPVLRITSESPHAILINVCFDPFLVVYLATYVRMDRQILGTNDLRQNSLGRA
jgi:hypothetical protein